MSPQEMVRVLRENSKALHTIAATATVDRPTEHDIRLVAANLDALALEVATKFAGVLR
jgi:hypothetical protein